MVSRSFLHFVTNLPYYHGWGGLEPISLGLPAMTQKVMVTAMLRLAAHIVSAALKQVHHVWPYRKVLVIIPDRLWNNVCSILPGPHDPPQPLEDGALTGLLFQLRRRRGIFIQLGCLAVEIRLSNLCCVRVGSGGLAGAFCWSGDVLGAVGISNRRSQAIPKALAFRESSMGSCNIVFIPFSGPLWKPLSILKGALETKSKPAAPMLGSLG